ncbi:Utp21-domain-containing protein [Polychaeton citri CBS 116435]|uniref:Utp21-domain-containing protein n=1 Tax=Polychaeton citri CBS 116435 TaxID=1314669 RepID=A0A9P4UT96_9PEZI|nr:Utp21-domain-containing protein [Polychaeton citri CBS 116435]
MELVPRDGRLNKRQKLANGHGAKSSKQNVGQSRVFTPYRTVGLVSPTAVPFTSIPLGKTSFQITTSVGRSLQTYDLRRGLNLVFITRPQTPSLITASAAAKDKVFAAFGGAKGAQCGVWVFKRGKKEGELDWPWGWKQSVQSFCIFGSWIVGVCRSQILVWKGDTGELYTVLKTQGPVGFTPNIVSLPTFLNKILVGKADGSCDIWNISTGRLVFTILPPLAEDPVTAIEPTPALGLVAIAYTSGAVVLHDVKTDVPLISLTTPEATPVTSISFRTDGIGAGDDGRTPGVMATASSKSSDVTLWDLNNGGRKAGVLRSAHGHPSPANPGGISKVQFLHGQAIMVSSGLDNSLKTWIFDQTPFSPLPRILHERRGHGAPITEIQFLPSASDGSDDTGKWLLSGSGDRSLWGWSLRRDGQSTELSQGNIVSKAKKKGLMAAENQDRYAEMKCPPVTSIACSLNRDGGIGSMPGKQPIWQNPAKAKRSDAEISAMTGWESVVTTHEGDSAARTWFWGRKRAGRWAFPTTDGSIATSVTISPCGTFAFVGSKQGGIDMFNLQSGMHRQRFPARLTLAQARQLKVDMLKHGLVEDGEDKKGQKKFYRGQGRHAAAVVGLAVDNLNRTVVSAGRDGVVKFWSFATGLLEQQLDWSFYTGITSMFFQRSSDLIAFSCTDGAVRVVDISNQRLIRELKPSRTSVAAFDGLQISNLAVSSDRHWVAASVQQLVLLWDLPTGHLVDAFNLPAQCSSLAFSPTGEFLATATTESVGVDVWSNRTLFSHIPTHPITAVELEAIFKSERSQTPTASGETGMALIRASDSDEEINAEADESMVAGLDHDVDVDALSADLLKLSMVPKSRWQNLIHLDLIRQRNKPTEVPKKPEKAPFFLPSLNSQRSGHDALDPSSVTDSTDVTSLAEAEKERSRILKRQLQDNANGTITNSFTSLLRAASTTTKFSPFISHFSTLSPAAADIEIRSLKPDNNGVNELIAFVHASTWLIGQRTEFELAQAWMNVFLRLHGDAVMEDEDLRAAIETWRDRMVDERQRVESIAGYCGGVLGWLRAGRV